MARRNTAEISEEIVADLHPKFSTQLIAHEDAEKHLLAMLDAGRLPHALLLTGPQGIGKATFAYRIARFLLMPQESGSGLFGDPARADSFYVSPSHPIFRRIVAGSHSDLLVLEAPEIKIEDARRVADFLSLTPAESMWRVVIIDSADALNRNAANALLKTLEEPPAQAMLILISHNPGNLLPTIRSRCRVMRMKPLEQKEFDAVMAMAAPDMPPADYPLWSLLSGQSPGIALALSDAKAQIIYEDMLEHIVQPDTLKLHPFAERYARKDNDAGWQVLARLIPWLFLRIATQEMAESEVFNGERAMLRKLYHAKPLDLWTELWEKAAKLISDTNHLHLDRKQAILTLLRAASEVT